MPTHLTRRLFLSGLSAAAMTFDLRAATPTDLYALVAKQDRTRILTAADRYLAAAPITVTSAHSSRSTGGPHDYFSEGDYWWPDPANPAAPYIRRDGFSNPANFNDHREALIRLSLIAPTLAAAFRLTRDTRYSAHFATHLRAWFIAPPTRMNPNLQYAQAITGVSPGRGIGIIDTLHLVEVVRAIRVMEAAHAIPSADIAALRAWFAAYVDWMATSKNGIEERDAKNNHGTCWVLQAAEFSQFANRPTITTLCRDRFKTSLVPDQIAADGTLPLELARTKPFSYSLFDMDVFATLCQSLSTPHEDLWRFKGPNGAGVAQVVAWLTPYMADKSTWPYPKDVEYFDDLPARRPALIFASAALNLPAYIPLWRRLDPDPTVPEVIRNMPIRQPILWLDPILP